MNVRRNGGEPTDTRPWTGPLLPSASCALGTPHVKGLLTRSGDRATDLVQRITDAAAERVDRSPDPDCDHTDENGVLVHDVRRITSS